MELPRGAAAKTPARSHMVRRRALVLIGVHLLFALHMWHWSRGGRTLSPLEPSEAMEFSKHSVINAGLILFAIAAVATLLFGRFFCGWGCHLVALQDLCRAWLLRLGLKPRALRSRWLAWVPALAFLYMFVLPVVSRIVAGDDLGVRHTNFQTVDFWRTFPPWWGALVTLLICGFGTVYLLGSKGFCTYACPYGALFSALDRFSPTRIVVDESCAGCGHCSATCSSNVAVAKEVALHGKVVDPGCMKCMDCVSVCPTGALSLGLARPALFTPAAGSKGGRGLRREVLLGASFLILFFSFYRLYKVVPFLLALGIAAGGAALITNALGLPGRDQTSLGAAVLKRGGKLTRTGLAALGAASLLVLIAGHSAAIQVLGSRSAHHFEALHELRGEWFTSRRSLPTDPHIQAARAVLSSAGAALRWGLIEDPRRHQEAAWASLLLGDGAGFAQHQDQVIAAAPRAGLPHLELGNHLRAQGRREEAAVHYQRAVEKEPLLEFAYPMLADLLVELGREPEVPSLLEEGLFALPGSELLRARLSANREFQQLRTELQRAPENLNLRAHLADRWISLGRPQEALRLLEEGAQLDPEQSAPWRVLGHARLQLGDVAGAQVACRRALALPDPAGESARLWARIEAAQGMLDADGNGR